MKQPTDPFLDQTVKFWQARTSRVLTQEDARQIIENTTGFFRVLQEWKIAEEQQEHPAQPDNGAEEQPDNKPTRSRK